MLWFLYGNIEKWGMATQQPRNQICKRTTHWVWQLICPYQNSYNEEKYILETFILPCLKQTKKWTWKAARELLFPCTPSFMNLFKKWSWLLQREILALGYRHDIPFRLFHAPHADVVRIIIILTCWSISHKQDWRHEKFGTFTDSNPRWVSQDKTASRSIRSDQKVSLGWNGRREKGQDDSE